MIALKPDIARGFGSACETYEGVSRLQRFMGNTMLQKVQSGAQSVLPTCILDLGCGTGWFSRQLGEAYPDAEITGMDLSPGMIAHARRSSGPEFCWRVADAESIPLPDQSVDLIFSNLMLQWCQDPRVVFQECQRVLKPGGRLMISSLLDGTLAELRQAWSEVDPGVEHVNQFLSESDFRSRLDDILPGACLEVRTLQLPYESPQDLASELKNLGAGYKGEQRRKSVTGPGRWRKMCRRYPIQPDGRVLASYEAAWVYWETASL